MRNRRRSRKASQAQTQQSIGRPRGTRPSPTNANKCCGSSEVPWCSVSPLLLGVLLLPYLGSLIAMGRPRYRERREQSDAAEQNRHFNVQGEADRRNFWQPPTRLVVGYGELWIAAEDDITQEFLETFNPRPMTVTCKDMPVQSVNDACQAANARNLFIFNVGYRRDRMKDWWPLLENMRVQMNNGGAVVLHCRA